MVVPSATTLVAAMTTCRSWHRSHRVLGLFFGTLEFDGSGAQPWPMRPVIYLLTLSLTRAAGCFF
jgi:hypothetical protein